MTRRKIILTEAQFNTALDNLVSEQENKIYTDFDSAWDYKFVNNMWYGTRKGKNKWVSLAKYPTAIKKLNTRYNPNPVKQAVKKTINKVQNVKKTAQNRVNKAQANRGDFGDKLRAKGTEFGNKLRATGKSIGNKVDTFGNKIKDFDDKLSDKLRKGAAMFSSLFDGVPEDSPEVTSTTHLVFDGNFMSMSNGNSPLKRWGAIAGITPWNTGRNVNKNTTEFQTHKGEGPLPEGNYVIGKIQTRDQKVDNDIISRIKRAIHTSGNNSDGEDLSTDWQKGTTQSQMAWGNHRIAIQPSKGTNTFGRGGFYVHGGAVRGSHGCIDLTTNMGDFTKHYAAWQGKHGKTSIPLVVKYPENVNKSAWGRVMSAASHIAGYGRQT